MGGGYKRPGGDSVDVIVETTNALDDRASKLERPSGTERTKALATLQAQVATLTALLAARLSPDERHIITSGFAVATADTEYARVTFTVPPGYTRAVVIATSSVSAFNNLSGVNITMRGYCDIAGLYSAPTVATTIVMITQGSVSPGASANLSGLVGGSTFYVRVMASLAISSFGADSRNIAAVNATVIFLP